MSEFNGRRADEDIIPTVEEFDGFGELTVGGSVAAGDTNRLVFTALAMLDDPAVNQYLLANKVKMQDRITKTRIFPRDGMSLPGGEVFSFPQEEVVELPDAQESE
jgi:hypothetical protein